MIIWLLFGFEGTRNFFLERKPTAAGQLTAFVGRVIYHIISIRKWKATSKQEKAETETNASTPVNISRATNNKEEAEEPTV